MRLSGKAGRSANGFVLLLSAAALPLLSPVSTYAQEKGGTQVDISLDKLEVVNRGASAKLGEIHLNAAADSGLAWVDGVDINEGCLSLEVQGSNEFGRSFVGVAFRGVDRNTYDVVYVRPFVFQSDKPEYVANGLQYMSMPDYGWPVLRERHPGIYETSIGSSPKPEDWVRLVVKFGGGRVKVFVNGSVAPQLDVSLLTSQTAGRAALWVGNNSSGAFRNFRICS